MSITYAEQKAPENIQKHYTPKGLATDLFNLVPVKEGDIVLDPASGDGVFPCTLSLDIQSGEDYLISNIQYDWAITNPPYHLLWKFIEKATEARKGFAFLVNINGINTLTPKRLQFLKDKGFAMRRLHVINVKQWHGRYFFYIFQKEEGACELTWNTKLYSSSHL